MPATRKTEISAFEFARLGGYTTLRPVYELIWLRRVQARKVGRKWMIDAASAARCLKARQNRRDAASAEEVAAL